MSSNRVDIWKAIENEDIESIRAYASSGGDMNVRSRTYDTPLRYAIELNKLNSYETLLKDGADPNFVFRDGHVGTHLAADNKDIRWLQLALDAGGDPNLMNSGKGLTRETPLYFAIVRSHVSTSAPNRIEQVRMLLTHGAEVNLPCDIDGSPPIAQACRQNEFEVVHLLLETGADYLGPQPYYADTFMATMKDKRSENYSYDPHVEQWCQKVKEWLVGHGADPQRAQWNGTGWEIK